jgi:hypothetical protein
MLCFCFCFFKDMHYNTMIHTFCIMKTMTFSALHYLTFSVRCEELDAHTLNVRTTYHIYYFTFKLYFFVIHFFVTIVKLYSFKTYISYRPIVVSSSAMTLIMYILRSYQLRNLLTLIVENWSKFLY